MEAEASDFTCCCNLAAASHEVWMGDREIEGWTRGLVTLITYSNTIRGELQISLGGILVPLFIMEYGRVAL